MVEARGGASLPEEELAGARMVAQVIGQPLDGDGPLEAQVARRAAFGGGQLEEADPQVLDELEALGYLVR